MKYEDFHQTIKEAASAHKTEHDTLLSRWMREINLQYFYPIGGQRTVMHSFFSSSCSSSS